MGEDRLAETRAKILTQSLEDSNQPKFGYFGFSGPLCIGDDSYAPRTMRKAPAEGDDEGPKGNMVTRPLQKGTHPSVYFSFAPPLALDDPYQDPGMMTKKGKVQMLDPDAAFKPPGTIKASANKLGYEYVPHCDSVKDPHAVKEALKDVMPLRQIYTNPTKKGGGGVLTSGVLFGWGEERRGQPEHVPDDYDAARKMRKEELAHHQTKTQETAFKSMAYGNGNFSTNVESFHCDVPSHVPRDPPPSTFVNPHEVAFRPANPMRKGMLKGLMGGFPEHIPDPCHQAERKPPPGEGEEKLPFKIGCPQMTVKPTPSVTTLKRNMRNERPSSFARPLL